MRNVTKYSHRVLPLHSTDTASTERPTQHSGLLANMRSKSSAAYLLHWH